jgi:hypothetical protein
MVQGYLSILLCLRIEIIYEEKVWQKARQKRSLCRSSIISWDPSSTWQNTDISDCPQLGPTMGVRIRKEGQAFSLSLELAPSLPPSSNYSIVGKESSNHTARKKPKREGREEATFSAMLALGEWGKPVATNSFKKNLFVIFIVDNSEPIRAGVYMHVFFTTNKNFPHTAELEPLVFQFSKWDNDLN